MFRSLESLQIPLVELELDDAVLSHHYVYVNIVYWLLVVDIELILDFEEAHQPVHFVSRFLADVGAEAQDIQ